MRASSIIEKGLRQKPDFRVNSTKSPPCNLTLCSNERPSSMTTTLAPAPRRLAHSSCRSTDLPEPDLPQIATLWLPASFSNGDQKNGCPRLPISSKCGSGPPKNSPCIGAILAAVVDSIVRMRFKRCKSFAKPSASISGIGASNPWICRKRSSIRSQPAAL